MNNLNVKELDDSALISFFKESGDKSLVGELFVRYTRMTMGVCMKYLKDEEESKDAVMQIFEKLLLDLPHHNIENFRSWLYSVAKNHCLMQLRKSKTKETYHEKIDFQENSMENDHESHPAIEKERQLQKMEKGMMELEEEQHKCLELFFLKDKCYQEIVNITGYSLNQVKSYIQNGKRNLRIHMMKK